eukprot:scaffold3043_cov360-Prasinococcus_capsulatus_cf.AAC.9
MFDLAIGADVLYRDEDAPSLAAAIAMRCATAYLLISVRYWKILNNLLEILHERGFQCEVSPVPPMPDILMKANNGVIELWRLLDEVRAEWITVAQWSTHARVPDSKRKLASGGICSIGWMDLVLKGASVSPATSTRGRPGARATLHNAMRATWLPSRVTRSIRRTAKRRAVAGSMWDRISHAAHCIQCKRIADNLHRAMIDSCELSGMLLQIPIRFEVLLYLAMRRRPA